MGHLCVTEKKKAVENQRLFYIWRADGRDTCVSLVPQLGQQVFYSLSSALTAAYLYVNGYTVANGDS